MIWKAFISFNDSCLLFRSSIELLTPRLSPWVSCTEDLILYRTSGQTVTICSFPLRSFPEKLSFLGYPSFLHPTSQCLREIETLLFVLNILLLGIGYQMKHSPRVLFITSRCLNIGWNTPRFVFSILLLGVLISDETLLLVLAILHLGVWISHKTLLLVPDILNLVVWISDETVLLVFGVFLLGVWISDERTTYFSCLLPFTGGIFDQALRLRLYFSDIHSQPHDRSGIRAVIYVVA